MDVLVQGALTSATIALVALGFSLVYGVGGIVNLAHGSFFMIGAYAAYAATDAGAPLAVAVPVQRRKGERRPEPVLSEAYAHLSVEGLREYRRALSEEEHRVSYWRRILQARLDLVGRYLAGEERVAPVRTGRWEDLGAVVIEQRLDLPLRQASRQEDKGTSEG